MALPRGEGSMKKLERVVLHTFLDNYPFDASYKEVVELLGTNKVELMESFKDCDPQNIREAMMFLMTDIQNLIAHEILEYDKAFVRNQQRASQPLHCKCCE